LAFHFADQALALEGRASELGKVIANASPVGESHDGDTLAWRYAGQAIEYGTSLTEGPAQRTLLRLARYAVDRNAGDAVDLRALMDDRAGFN